MRERTHLAGQVEAVNRLQREVNDALEFAEMAQAEGDEASLDDVAGQLAALKAFAAKAELEALLSGEADGADAYLEVNAGAGGTESTDWAAMLLRMYTRWAGAHAMDVEIIEETDGEQVGIKSATVKISGTNAYGWLKTEADLGLSGGGRQDRDRHQSRRCAHRHLSGQRLGRAACEQDRLGRAPDPHPHRHRGGLPEPAVTAPEPRSGLEDAARPPL
jgi:hypothetical protein